MKKLAYAIIFVGLVMTFAACSWQIPEKVSVKSNAEYNAFSDEDPEDYTIGLTNNNFIIDPDVIHNELGFTKVELVFKGLGDDTRIYVKSDEPLPKKYGIRV